MMTLEDVATYAKTNLGIALSKNELASIQGWLSGNFYYPSHTPGITRALTVFHSYRNHITRKAITC